MSKEIDEMMSWQNIVKCAKLKGVTAHLASHCKIQGQAFVNNMMHIVLDCDKEGEFLVTESNFYKLKTALEHYFGEKIGLGILVSKEQRLH